MSSQGPERKIKSFEGAGPKGDAWLHDDLMSPQEEQEWLQEMQDQGRVPPATLQPGYANNPWRPGQTQEPQSSLPTTQTPEGLPSAPEMGAPSSSSAREMTGSSSGSDPSQTSSETTSRDMTDSQGSRTAGTDGG